MSTPGGAAGRLDEGHCRNTVAFSLFSLNNLYPPLFFTFTYFLVQAPEYPEQEGDRENGRGQPERFDRKQDHAEKLSRPGREQQAEPGRLLATGEARRAKDLLRNP